MEIAVAILKDTPWWVYVLFIYLLFIGFKATKTNTVHIVKLSIIPALFTYLSIETLILTLPTNFFTVSTCVGMIGMGSLLGMLQAYRVKIKVDKKRWLVHLPGTWTTLIFILIAFSTKYYFEYELKIKPQLGQDPSFLFESLAVPGLITGLFIGKLLVYLYRLRTEPHMDL